MGLYRFWLAITVVMFHMGGISWVSGRMAVFSFYCVSGYLIFRVLDKVYLRGWMHIIFFYTNRLLRLAPLYFVISILTYYLLWTRGGTGYVIDNGDPPYNFIAEANRVLSIDFAYLFVSEITFGWKMLVQPVPTLSFHPILIPQGWSIGVELCFYIFAPLMVFLCRRSLIYLAPFVFASAVIFFSGVVAASSDIGFMDNYVYKNFLASGFMFLLGGAMYFISKKIAWRFSAKWLIIFLATYIGYVWYGSDAVLLGYREPAVPVFWLNLLLTIPATLLVVFSEIKSNFWRRIDTAIGNLSYGIYLNHLLLYFNEKVFEFSGIYRFFGRLNTWVFGMSAIILSFILAILLYWLIELRVEKVRLLLKR